MFAGKKTYIVAFLLLLTALGGFLTGEKTLGEALNTETIQGVLAALGLATLRLGIGDK